MHRGKLRVRAHGFVQAIEELHRVLAKLDHRLGRQPTALASIGDDDHAYLELDASLVHWGMLLLGTRGALSQVLCPAAVICDRVDLAAGAVSRRPVRL